MADGSGKLLRRKATWIDKSINLKQVLRDPRALRALQDFAISIHAGENVAVWCVGASDRADAAFAKTQNRVAIEFFKIQHISTPKSRVTARKRLSEQLGNLHLGDEDEDPSLFTHADPEHAEVKDLTAEQREEKGLTEAQMAIHRDATRIFRTFFEEGAPHWTCVDDHVVTQMRDTLSDGAPLDVSFFNDAQHQVFLMMQNDTFPRFIKAVLADPDKFSTGERLEIDAETREHLDKIFEAGAAGDRSSQRVRSMKLDAERTIHSPKSAMKKEVA